MIELLDFGIDDAVDILLVSVLLWGGILWLRRTRARLAVPALAGIAVIYLAANRLGLELTSALLQGFFAVFAIVLVVIFQEDLRRLFERISAWGLRRTRAAVPTPVTDMVARSVASMAASRTGALLVFPGGESIERHVEGGVYLNGRVSEPLLLSLFDSSSPGHDGAVVLEGDRVASFAVHLPLSSDHQQLGPGGTRHAAALGLAELTDALCVVVSEERGTVSVAHNGTLRVLRDPARLAGELAEFSRSLSPPAQVRERWQVVGRSWREALAGLGIATALWLLLVPGASVIEAQLAADVLVDNLPPGFEVESVEPEEVQLAVRGTRRALALANPDSVRIRLDAFLVQLGRRTFELSPERAEVPGDIEVLSVDPERVVLRTRKVSAAEPEG